MVGRPILEALQRATVEPGRVVLAVEAVSARNDRGLPALRDVSLEVHAGEIVGIAAVAGNGQAELAEAITGLRPCSGRITVDGNDVANRSADVAIKAGVGHVPEDRAGVGSAPNLSITDNVIMKRYRQPPISSGWFMDDGASRSMAERLTAAYVMGAPPIDTQVRILSGGNLQRVILAREIDAAPTLLVAVQPTRGLDVGAIEGIHQTLLDLRAGGTAVLLVSEELDELISLCDRILVMYEGRIAAVVEPATTDFHEIGIAMTGGAA
jgi:simple sugar transport system ATP-binding protein